MTFRLPCIINIKIMIEQPPFREYEESSTFEIDTPTAFALREYIQDNNVGLAHAVNDMIDMGRFVYEAEGAGIVFAVEYPDGEGFYEADEALFDTIRRVQRIEQAVRPDHQIALDSIAGDLDKNRSEVLMMLVEKARTLRLQHRKKAVITMIAPDGSRRQLRFRREI